MSIDMGTMAEAEAALEARGRTWRALRQPAIATRAEHRETEAKEREARIRLAEAALLWLWHREQGRCKEGDRCVCGGDTPEVRATCSNWIK